MEIPSYPLPTHHPFFTGSSCAPPSYRIYTATETANGSFFQPSFKEALKGTHRAFDGSEVSAPRTTSIERDCFAKSWPETERRMARSSCAESWSRVNVVIRRYSLSEQKSLLRIVNDREDKRWLRICISNGNVMSLRLYFDFEWDYDSDGLKFVFLADTIWTFSSEEIKM